jgi:phosphopantothenoylcysteine decarboxylase/phosphopantothenate--cysteine ligase
MNVIVTAGPTYEPLDQVRRLTNFSTGRLGTELANYLGRLGSKVTLLRGEQSSYSRKPAGVAVEVFTTTQDLESKLKALAADNVTALLHAAAVSDFRFGKIWQRSADGELTELHGAKIPTRDGTVLAELLPTRKVLGRLRDWFPRARIIGWKYEMEGDRARVLQLAEKQIQDARSDGCVANGKGYGAGFGLVTGPGQCKHFADMHDLFEALHKLIKSSLADEKS